MSDSPKVLILEDSRDLLTLYRAFLAKSGAEVMTAESCQKALECIAKEKPEVLIMDLTLGDMSAEEFYRQFSMIPEAEKVKIFLVSGRDDLASWAEAFNAKAFFRKPVSKDVLLKAVQENLH